MSQALPRNVFEILVFALGGEKEKAEQFASGIETLVSAQGKTLKNEVKEELKNELITRELFLVHAQLMEEKFQIVEERFKMIDERFKVAEKSNEDRFKTLDWKINVLITLMTLFGTFLNPAFLAFLSKLLKI
ncbi:MAG: hypothetical protein ACK481_03055 [Candidatus Melainabacteria bacterium]|jgi:hypothetical protein